MRGCSDSRGHGHGHDEWRAALNRLLKEEWVGGELASSVN